LMSLELDLLTEDSIQPNKHARTKWNLIPEA